MLQLQSPHGWAKQLGFSENNRTAIISLDKGKMTVEKDIFDTSILNAKSFLELIKHKEKGMKTCKICR